MNKREADERLGKNLRAVRDRRGISRWKLQTITGVSEDTIYKLETARRSPKISTLLRLADGLGVDVGVLLDGIDWKPGDGKT
jgi:transcriptional regulator with XRE-family HTH domain